MGESRVTTLPEWLHAGEHGAGDHAARPPHSDSVSGASPYRPRRWKPTWVSWAIAILMTLALCTGLYTMTASWLASYAQSRIIEQDFSAAAPDHGPELLQAREYNASLSAGARLDANANIPAGTGTTSDSELGYGDLLADSPTGVMARVKIPTIDVDLPIFHGTSAATLNMGAGHLEGTHLPVGGVGTRTVVTAHRGLANATMFTNLDKVVEGDRFVIETAGEAFTYEVRDIQVVEPNDSQSIVPDRSRDLATLITCTPLGVNSHRIVVTGERVTPTPIADANAVGEAPTIPGFPWWALLGIGGLAVVTAFIIRAGFVDARTRDVVADAADDGNERDR